jgi:hypothetical protein
MLTKVQESWKKLKEDIELGLGRPSKRPNAISIQAVYSRHIVGRALDFYVRIWEFTVIGDGPYAGKDLCLHMPEDKPEYGFAYFWETDGPLHVFVRADEDLENKFRKAAINAGGLYSIEISVELFRPKSFPEISPYTVTDFKYVINSKELLPEGEVTN